MKFLYSLLLITLVGACASGKEKSYTASTPAGAEVRTFLGILLTDSIDFIRWKLIIRDNQYTLSCNYGIGKPNTNGFYDGGKKVELSGSVIKEKNFYQFHNGEKTIRVIELDENLLHLVDAGNNLLIGNGGWSYTLNSTMPLTIAQNKISPKATVLKDSMVFDGRTPCGIPGIIPAGTDCYKLKWRIVFYGNAEKNEPTTYKILGTTWRNPGGKKGAWKIIPGRQGHIVYQLYDENGKPLLYLLKADENILLFTDAREQLLTGNEDFSFTLNRKI